MQMLLRVCGIAQRRERRSRATFRRNAPMIVWGRPHLENQFAAIHDLFVADINFVEWLAVQRRPLNVWFLRTVVSGNDGEGFSVVQPEACPVKQRTAD